MPRIRPLLREDKLKYRVEKECFEAEKLMLLHRISKTEIAELQGITPQAVSAQFRVKHITIDTRCAIDQIIEEREELARLKA